MCQASVIDNLESPKKEVYIKLNDVLEFAESVQEILDKATDIFYNDSSTARAHYKLGILAQYVHEQVIRWKQDAES